MRVHNAFRFLRRSDGQDLSEYCLLTALVALLALALFWHVTGGLGELWGTSNTTLGSAANIAGTAAAGSDGSPAGR